MANARHLKRLKQGAKGWHQWRKNNPEVRPDLREATLIGVNLRGADLSALGLCCVRVDG